MMPVILVHLTIFPQFCQGMEQLLKLNLVTDFLICMFVEEEKT